MGGWLLELMKHGISAAVNSDTIEDSGFQPRDVFYCFLLCLIGYIVMFSPSVVGLCKGSYVWGL